MTTNQNPTAGARCAADMSALLRARNPLIVLVTPEEPRAVRIASEAAASAGYPIRAWNCAAGIHDPIGRRPIDAGRTDPGEALAYIKQRTERAVFIMADLGPMLRDPYIARALRNLVLELPEAPRDLARAIVLIQPSAELPAELKAHAIVIEVPLPDRTEVAAILDAAVDALPDDLKANAATNGAREAAIDAALGLGAEESQRSFAYSLIKSRKVDPAVVNAEKKRAVESIPGLEWYGANPRGLSAIGGFDCFKQWAELRADTFSPAARAYGLKPPRGVLLIGPPGTGKSLAAKCLAAYWSMILIRWDLNAGKSKYVGQSEANIRTAQRTIDALGRALVWIDEIDKVISGATDGASDGGVSTDQVGALLTWQQERKSSGCVFATANNIEAIAKSKPELLRRFDAIFYVDLPSRKDRAEIIKAAMIEHGRPEDPIDAEAVGSVTEGFSGSEIAGLVPASMFVAFKDGQRPVCTADLIAAAGECVPLSRTAAETINQLREWAQGRAKPASMPEQMTASDRRTLDL